MFSTIVDVLSTFKSVKKKINSSFPKEHCETSPSNIINNTEKLSTYQKTVNTWCKQRTTAWQRKWNTATASWPSPASAPWEESSDGVLHVSTPLWQRSKASTISQNMFTGTQIKKNAYFLKANILCLLAYLVWVGLETRSCWVTLTSLELAMQTWSWSWSNPLASTYKCWDPKWMTLHLGGCCCFKF